MNKNINIMNNNLEKHIVKLEAMLGYKFQNKNYIETALTHRSYIVKPGANPNSYNQRLECLGDRVLGLVVLTYLYKNFPNKDEGYISKFASYLTSSAILFEISKDLELDKYVLRAGTSEDSIFIDATEAIFAAIYLDSNLSLDEITEVLLNLLKKYISQYRKTDVYNVFNPKSFLQEWLQQNKIDIPEYIDMEQTGPDHDPEFVVVLKVNGYDDITGIGSNKKEAQKQAALNFIKQYKLN